MFDFEACRPLYKDNTLTFVTKADIDVFRFMIGRSKKKLSTDAKRALRRCFKNANDVFAAALCFRGKTLQWTTRHALASATIDFYLDLYGIIFELASEMVAEFIAFKLGADFSEEVRVALRNLESKAEAETIIDNVVSIIRKSNGVIQPINRPRKLFFKTYFKGRS